jgi:nucleotide-binding universal stress UspA family protein
MNEMTTILFATDFSEVSDSAFEYAASLAATYNARLVVLHVVAHQTDLRSFYVPHISFDDLDQQVEVGAKQRMNEFCNRWRGQFPDLIACVVTGIPQVEILKKALDVTASMIVMGTHGRQGFEHFIFGSTAEGVVKTAPCPVLTVRPQS